MRNYSLVKDGVILKNNVKRYFEQIYNLMETNEEFPVDFELVYFLVYANKQNAVRELRNNFIQDIDYQISILNDGNMVGRRTENYKLSVPCMEHFIARKVPEVFEVYRQVFHQKVEEIKQEVKPSINNDVISALELFLDAIKNHNIRIGKLEDDVDDLKNARFTDYSAVTEYAKKNNILGIDTGTFRRLGIDASKICKERGIEVKKAKFANAYPESICKEVFRNKSLAA